MHSRLRVDLYPPHRQRGVIGVLGAAVLLLSLVFTALAIDTGRLWMYQRQLQSIADKAAISAARQMGCDFTQPTLAAAAQAAAIRNGFVGDLGSAPNLVELGDIIDVGGIRQFVTSGQEAVRVVVTRDTPASVIAGGLFGNMVRLQAVAVAKADPSIASFSAGTTAISLDTSDAAILNALLGSMLGTSLDLDLLSYQGLAAARVSLLNLLQAQGGVNNINDYLNQDVPINQFLGNIATALSNNGITDPGVIAAVQQLADAANSNDIRIGDVVRVTRGESASTLGINVLSLVTTSAIVSNGSNPIMLTSSPLAGVNVLITVLEAPKPAQGPPGNCTTISTGQFRVQAGVVQTIAGVTLDLNLVAEVGRGTATLRDISDDGSQAQVLIEANPGITLLSLSNTAQSGSARLTVNIPLIGTIVADLGLNLPGQAASGQALNMEVAHPVAENLSMMASVASPLGSSLQSMLSQPGMITVDIVNPPLLGGLLTAATTVVNGLVSGTVAPLVGQIATQLLDPLLDILGIQIGGMDVILHDVKLYDAKPIVI